MKAKTFTVLAVFLGILIIPVSYAKTAVTATAATSTQLYSVLSEKNADRLLLVAFTDRTIGSLKNSASPTSYRNRGGDYQSSTWSQGITDGLAEDYHLQKLTEWPMTEVGMHCVVYQVADKAALPQAIEKLSKDDRVEVVQNMNVYKTKARTSQLSNDPYYKLQTNLHQMQIEMAHSLATGRNIIIGMIDTGVDIDHPDLTGQVSQNENLVGDMSPSFATDKHGTAVAGIMVARKDNAQGIVGVAPNAKLIALKACWPDKADAIEAVCNSYTLALAVNTAIKAGVKVLNMSLSGPKDPLVTVLLNKAIDNGMIVVAADSESNNSAENFPASLPGVVSVRSVRGTETLPTSVAAPGEKVLTTLPNATYDFISGSSIAAAEVSGVVALLLELKPNMTVAEVQAILQKAKMPSKAGGVAGVNASQALSSLCGEAALCERHAMNYAQANSM